MLKKSYRLDGSRVLMKLTHIDDRTGEIRNETEISQGERAAELDRATRQVNEETAKRDAIKNAGAETPLTPSGPQGTVKRYFTRGGFVFEQEVRRIGDGSVHFSRSRNLGHQAQVMADTNERLRELTEHRDGVKNAK